MNKPTRSALIKRGEVLMRTRGYSGFSYADLAVDVGIKKPSIHHHFPTKELLGLALVGDYLEEFIATLQKIKDTKTSATDRLRSYAQLFFASIKEDTLPLCCALAVEMNAMPESLRNKAREIFDLHMRWLEEVLREGIDSGELDSSLDVRDTTVLVLSTLEGTSVIAQAVRDVGSLTRTIDLLLSTIRSRS